MMKYPPIDPVFYETDAKLGMSDSEIEADWVAYCEGMNDFCAELDAQQSSIDEKRTLTDVLKDIVATFSKDIVSRNTPKEHVEETR